MTGWYKGSTQIWFWTTRIIVVRWTPYFLASSSYFIVLFRDLISFTNDQFRPDDLLYDWYSLPIHEQLSGQYPLSLSMRSSVKAVSYPDWIAQSLKLSNDDIHSLHTNMPLAPYRAYDLWDTFKHLALMFAQMRFNRISILLRIVRDLLKQVMHIPVLLRSDALWRKLQLHTEQFSGTYRFFVIKVA